MWEWKICVPESGAFRARIMPLHTQADWRSLLGWNLNCRNKTSRRPPGDSGPLFTVLSCFSMDLWFREKRGISLYNFCRCSSSDMHFKTCFWTFSLLEAGCSVNSQKALLERQSLLLRGEGSQNSSFFVQSLESQQKDFLLCFSKMPGEYNTFITRGTHAHAYDTFATCLPIYNALHLPPLLFSPCCPLPFPYATQPTSRDFCLPSHALHRISLNWAFVLVCVLKHAVSCWRLNLADVCSLLITRLLWFETTIICRDFRLIKGKLGLPGPTSSLKMWLKEGKFSFIMFVVDENFVEYHMAAPSHCT